MKIIFWLATVICTIGFWSKCDAGDSAFTLPEKLNASDKVIVYKIRISDEYSLRQGKQFHQYLIVSESEALSSQAATNLYKLFKQAFPVDASHVKGGAIWPCIFAPTVGVSFQIDGQKIDAAVSFDCSKMCFFNGEVPIRNSSLLSIRSELLAQLRMIFPKDEEIQSLK
jgi:hypothetical protein